MPSDPLDLDALERMEKAATPAPLDGSPWVGVSVGEDEDANFYAFGPAHQCECDEPHDFTDSDGNDTPTDCTALLRARADRDLFRALRNAAPALIARARLAERMAEALRMTCAPQACDGSGSTIIEHWDCEGRYEGDEHVSCYGCSACCGPMRESVLREWDALNEKGGTE